MTDSTDSRPARKRATHTSARPSHIMLAVEQPAATRSDALSATKLDHPAITRAAPASVRATTRAPTQATPAGASRDSNQRKTVADDVYLQLRSRLIAGAYLPAQKLTLRALAQEFGTSMMPVRDAVRRLSAQGGLQLNVNRTIQVNAPTSEEFEEMLKIRAALEGLACEHAVKRMRDAEVSRIRQIETRFEREALRLRPNPELLSKINRDFHFGIYRASRMPQLITLIENLWVQVSPVLSLAIRHTAQGLTLRDAQRHHTKLVDSINKRDANRARQALIADIREAGELILRSGLLRQYDRNPSGDVSSTSQGRQYRLR